MATVVDACVCEITKLSEKVRNRSFFLLKSQKKKKSGDKVEESKNSQNSSSTSVAETKNDNTMCEATVFLLMDRFAPC
uniref:Uncharacterized protein n=1 Tax=Nicotiana tabacum TaxID=4097 RepID=A0A1S3Y4Q3_TOBAC|nr:uncharacterized protein LOC104106916 [Nicotiana tomentosiformis]XP_016447131.1 PREDICTED: uncharacterized protein LOC107772155 [Nicotiana tabacum]